MRRDAAGTLVNACLRFPRCASSMPPTPAPTIPNIIIEDPQGNESATVTVISDGDSDPLADVEAPRMRFTLPGDFSLVTDRLAFARAVARAVLLRGSQGNQSRRRLSPRMIRQIAIFSGSIQVQVTFTPTTVLPPTLNNNTIGITFNNTVINSIAAPSICTSGCAVTTTATTTTTTMEGAVSAGAGSGSSGTSGASTGAIAGGAVAGVALVALLVLAIVFGRRKNADKSAVPEFDVEAGSSDTLHSHTTFQQPTTVKNECYESAERYDAAAGPLYAEPCPAGAVTEDAVFEPNGFVPQVDGTCRIMSVKRANPSFRSSDDTPVGKAVVDTPAHA